MCLKTCTILLQYYFTIQLHSITIHYFITTCLCLVEIYQYIFQSNSFNGNDLMVLFNYGWSRLTSNLSLMKSLNLFASEARISKWLSIEKSIEQLHSSSLSDIADCLTLLRRFPIKLDIPICSAALVKKWWYVLP